MTIKKIYKISEEVYKYLGGLNFDERDYQKAFGYELTKARIDYLREINLELFYKEIPIKLGAPDFFLNSYKPPVLIELKLGSSLQNAHRQQLKMYLVSINRNPKSVLTKVNHGMIINFLKEDTNIVDHIKKKKRLDAKNVELEFYKLDKDEKLTLLDKI